MSNKSVNAKEFVVDVAGVSYFVKLLAPDKFEECNVRDVMGFTDYSTRTICVCDFTQEEREPDAMQHQQFIVNNTIKHELVHAFLFETGHAAYSEDEVLVDCIAVTLEKIINMCTQADAINKELLTIPSAKLAA